MLKVKGATSGAIGGEFHFFARVCCVYFNGDPVHFLHSYRHIVDRVKEFFLASMILNRGNLFSPTIVSPHISPQTVIFVGFLILG